MERCPVPFFSMDYDFLGLMEACVELVPETIMTFVELPLRLTMPPPPNMLYIKICYC